MNFLHRFSSPFVGLSMRDENLRRFLARSKRELRGRESKREYFAILKEEEEAAYADAVLEAYGVRAIRIRDHREIPAILKRVYTSDCRNQEATKTWDALFGYWDRGRTTSPEDVLDRKPIERDFDGMWERLE